MTQLFLLERIVVQIADVLSASDSGPNSGSREDHASARDHAENVEVI